MTIKCSTNIVKLFFLSQQQLKHITNYCSFKNWKNKKSSVFEQHVSLLSRRISQNRFFFELRKIRHDILFSIPVPMGSEKEKLQAHRMK